MVCAADFNVFLCVSFTGRPGETSLVGANINPLIVTQRGVRPCRFTEYILYITDIKRVHFLKIFSFVRYSLEPKAWPGLFLETVGYVGLETTLVLFSLIN